MWDGPDGMGIGRVGDAMRNVAMQMGWDLMLCVAMPWDWIYSTMGGSVIAGCYYLHTVDRKSVVCR